MYFNGLPTIILVSLSGVIFFSYGTSCLINSGMKEEFQRFGLTRFRRLVGLLELLGGLGSMLGLIYPYLLILSSAGLSVLMLMGVVVRIRLKDPLIQISPAILLMLLNGYIFYFSLSNI
jgi:uncharacterized membrane protein YphA (DoxX/SURF4 family)